VQGKWQRTLLGFAQMVARYTERLEVRRGAAAKLAALQDRA